MKFTDLSGYGNGVRNVLRSGKISPPVPGQISFGDGGASGSGKGAHGRSSKLDLFGRGFPTHLPASSEMPLAVLQVLVLKKTC